VCRDPRLAEAEADADAELGVVVLFAVKLFREEELLPPMIRKMGMVATLRVVEWVGFGLVWLGLSDVVAVVTK
jgi:hypothetical protein